MNTCCTVVVGHVDHGKTTLVHALTGMETDRLPEEKARGLSIVPGFAHRSYSGGTMDFVDAPGHEDFVQAMINAAAGARAAVVVVAADEGMRAQTVEHLRITGLLGINKAVVALTKADLLSTAEMQASMDRLRASLVGTIGETAPVFPCSAKTGDGLEALNDALSHLLDDPPKIPTPPDSMLAIDRVFSRAGHGTVVTGTLLGRDLEVEDPLTLYPAARPVTLRGLETRGVGCSHIIAGARMAANLRGVALQDIARGDVLGKGLAPSKTMDVRLHLLPEVSAPKHLHEVRVSLGTTQAIAQLRFFQSDSGFAQLRFAKPVCGFAGQRVILRRLSPAETLGGAEILDPNAAPVKANDMSRPHLLHACETGDPAQIVIELAQKEGGVARLEDVARLSRLSVSTTAKALNAAFVSLGSGLVSHKQEVEDKKQAILQAVERYHKAHPLHVGAPQAELSRGSKAQALQDHVISVFLANGDLRRTGAGLALAHHTPFAALTADQRYRLQEIEALFRAAALVPVPTDPLSQDPLDKDLMGLLLDTGVLTPLQNVSLNQTLVFHAEVLNDAAGNLRAAFPPPGPFTTGAARDALGTTRRVIVPVLEHFDDTGVTLRQGDTRQIAP